VGTEDAAIDVRLVDDHIAEVGEDVSPAVVVREDADMKHVGVRQDEVRPLADLPALLARRVAVVDRCSQPRDLQGRNRAELVLGQRLRRVQVERAELRLPRQRVEHRQVERQRLPACGAGGDDQVPAATGRLPGVGLVRVEAVDAERGTDAWMQVVGKRREPRLARRLVSEIRELLALKQLVPQCGGGCHSAIEAATLL
jgi:hypothetical protein